MTRTRLLLFLVTSSLALAASARAADDDAAALIRRGVDLRREHRDEEALAAFTSAVALTPKPSARAQLALCEQALGRWVDAERDLDAALAAKDDAWIAKNAASLDEARGVVRKHLAWLTVDVDVASAAALLDGVALARSTETRVAAGDRVLEVRAPGYVPDVRRVPIAPEEHARVAITLAPLAAAAPAAPSEQPSTAPPPADVPPPRAPRSLAGPIALGAAGIVGIGVGSFFGLRTFAFKSDREAQCTPRCTAGALVSDDDARSSATASTIAFGAGLALVASGALWWALGRSGEAPSRAGVTIAPMIGGVSGVAIGGAL